MDELTEDQVRAGVRIGGPWQGPTANEWIERISREDDMDETRPTADLAALLALHTPGSVPYWVQVIHDIEAEGYVIRPADEGLDVERLARALQGAAIRQWIGTPAGVPRNTARILAEDLAREYAALAAKPTAASPADPSHEAWSQALADPTFRSSLKEGLADVAAGRVVGYSPAEPVASALPAPSEGGLPLPAEGTVFAWLIERGQPEGQAPTVWWRDREDAGGLHWDDWVTDAFKAVRFPTREAAEAVIADKSGIGPSRQFLARAVEHGFLEAGLVGTTGMLDTTYHSRRRARRRLSRETGR